MDIESDTTLHRFSRDSAGPPVALTRNSGIRIEQRDSTVTIEIPLACVERVFYRLMQGELLVSSDLRLLCQKGDSLDDDGVCSLLVLGGCVPPLTPYSQIRACLPGFTHQFDLNTGRCDIRPATSWSATSPGDRRLGVQDQVRWLRHTLDEAIEAARPGDAPIVLLSGGVDSAVVAARLVALGRRRTTLVHCSFGVEDEQTESAREIASALGLELEIVSWGESSGLDVLDSAGAIYSMPFVDSACVPAMVLANGIAAKDLTNRTLIDGLGADACFGKWRRANWSAWLYRSPGILRRGFGEVYDMLDLHRRVGPTEKVFRVIRRSSQLGRQAFLASQHPLAGIAVSASHSALDRLTRLCDEWAQGVAQGGDGEVLSSVVFVGLICGGIEAQKNQVFRSLDLPDLAYPYMSPGILDLAVSHARFWPGSRRPKNALRMLAAESLPRRVAMRPKRGFIPPHERLMAHPSFLEHLDAASHEGAPLSAYLDHGFVAQALKDLRSRRPLPLTIYTFLWGAAFCNAWLSQVERGAEGGRPPSLALGQATQTGE
jgi:hypothetical protein